MIFLSAITNYSPISLFELATNEWKLLTEVDQTSCVADNKMPYATILQYTFGMYTIEILVFICHWFVQYNHLICTAQPRRGRHTGEGQVFKFACVGW